MKKLPFFMVLSLVMGLAATQASAQPYAGPVAADSCETEAGSAAGVATPCQPEPNQNVYQAIEKILAEAGAPSLGLDSNADTDNLQILDNGYWDVLGGGDPSNVAVIAIGAANTNTLGVYPFGNPAGVVDIVPAQTGFQFLGDGTAGNPYPGGTINLATNFGFSLRSNFGSGEDIWYSDPTLNSDGIDHMMAFALPSLDGTSLFIDLNGTPTEITFGTGTVLLGWEDVSMGVSSSSDYDYNDTLFLISNLDNPTNVVPEPLSMVLFGTGLAGMAGLRRRKVA